MRNRLIFFVGLALLIVLIWATTMIGIDLNKKGKENNANFYHQNYGNLPSKDYNFDSNIAFFIKI